MRLLAAAVLLFLGEASGAQEKASVDFERDIRPLLFGRCVSCHGPGAGKAGLFLNERDKAVARLKSGSRAVVPGEPEKSELLARVASADPEERMPPKGEPLTPRQVGLLRAWIEEGAPWPVHWAYRPLRKPDPPRFENPDHERAILTPVDRFILRTLLDRGLAPSPPADPRALLRRVTFDLTGLAPSPEELDAFLADPSLPAYARAVDRLLASPRYGERWARHWMDVVRFAETHGHDQDRPRDHAWPYRDYLIRSFNEDKPYARFVQEQVAGDVLFPGDPWALVATGFLAAGPWDESSLRDIQADSIDRIVGQYLDRDDVVAGTMSTFASTTVHCARCHDHKFDPIAQSEYYSLQAVFAGVDKANRSYDPDPATGARRRELAARVREPGVAPADVVTAWEKALRPDAAWREVELESFRAESGSVLEKLPDGSILSGGAKPDRDTYVLVFRTPIPRITGLRVDVLTHESLPHQGPGRAVNGNLHLSEAELSGAGGRIALAQARADFDQAGWESPKILDGDPTTAWGIHPEEGKPHFVSFALKEPAATEPGVPWTLLLKQLHGRQHLIGRFRVRVTDAPPPFGPEPLPAEIAAIVGAPPERRDSAGQEALARYVARKEAERELAALPAQTLVYCGTPEFKPDGSFKPAGKPRPIHLLKRGDIRQPGPAAAASALSFLPGLPGTFAAADPENEGGRRASLARWLSDPSNVLAWRSIANRVWHYHFGRGLVDSPNDFGRMGGAPSHPELLDWLTATLLESGGSLKALHRLIVTSAVYRQASVHVPRFAEIDADNRLLWRMNRLRLEAEAAHDAILQASGKLDLSMGGPSVRLFLQKPGIHVTPLVDYSGFSPDDPANHRRSVYRFIFRTLPDPFLESLDCPDASQAAPRRENSVTALQALSLLNDKFVVRQSEHVAARAERAGPEGRVRELFRLVLGRAPSEKESASVGAYAARHGLANAARFLFNSNEFLFLD